ncbi:MAG: hypothetical protein GY797_04850 [Deltaproteobacteria bacterium]|nr:hypothetical protein [Deltaproteobacteria bacterium]
MTQTTFLVLNQTHHYGQFCGEDHSATLPVIVVWGRGSGYWKQGIVPSFD